ncbi:Ig-like domain-containing protein, partial [Shewanella sp. C32]|nr:Ig-like domain-containing protein [Shewanella electrica]
MNVASPANGATVSGSVTISAGASDPTGVTQVQFFVDGGLLSTDTTAPYGASWDTTSFPDGAHSLTAQAT